MPARRMKFKVPGFAYPGGKVKLRKWLVSMMPRSGRTYVEPFAGRGNVFWYAATQLKFERWWLNDLATAPFLEAIGRVELTDIPIRLSADGANELGHESRSENPSALSLVMAPRIIFGGGAKTGKRKSIRTSQLTLRNFSRRAYCHTISCARNILEKFQPQITSIDWLQSVSKLSSNDFCYLDPPYFQNVAGYTIDTINHPVFLSQVRRLQCAWLLSGYDSELYRTRLGEPYATRQVVFVMSRLHGKSQRQVRTECVWKGNY